MMYAKRWESLRNHDDHDYVGIFGKEVAEV